jgi:hypothetical protein
MHQDNRAENRLDSKSTQKASEEKAKRRKKNEQHKLSRLGSARFHHCIVTLDKEFLFEASLLLNLVSAASLALCRCMDRLK